MAYENLKAAIKQAIKQNGNQEITGDILQSTLLNMVNIIGEGATFAGIATPTTDPGTPEGNIFYVTSIPGVYTNFNIDKPKADYDISFLCYNVSDSQWKFFDIYQFGDIDYVTSNNDSDSDLSFSDGNGNIALEIRNGGHIKTNKFDSEALIGDDIDELVRTSNDSDSDLSFSDGNGNVALEIRNGGHIKTNKFDSEALIGVESPKDNTLILPSAALDMYTTCNDLDKSNKWGINSRNYGITVYLDNFFQANKELSLYLKDTALTHFTLSQDIIGSSNPSKWNNSETCFTKNIKKYTNDKSVININLHTVLNSASKTIKPIILQIGDSVTEGWFADYPTINGAPTQSYSWAKYYFDLDKKQNNNGDFFSLFVGSRDVVNYNFNGVSGRAFAEGYSGWSPREFCEGSLSGYSQLYKDTDTPVSIKTWLNKWKTLEDDGITRLTPGSTAGTLITDANAIDVCTPNIVIIQLGMNGSVSDFKTYIPIMINSIKKEYPDMIIIISMLMGCSCNYPSLYPDYENIYFEDWANAKKTLLECYSWAIDNIQNKDNDIYVIFTGALIPMPIGCNARELKNDLYELNPHKTYIGVDAIERVKHPSRFAHQVIGYEIYSAIKYILTSKQ